MAKAVKKRYFFVNNMVVKFEQASDSKISPGRLLDKIYWKWTVFLGKGEKTPLFAKIKWQKGKVVISGRQPKGCTPLI